MSQTLALIQEAHEGSESARELLVQNNLGLVHSIVRRFHGRGAEEEDLFQIGCIGLLKAIDHFDLNYDVKFSTYAVPMITGEIKRFLRDDGMLKVSRSLKELAYHAYQKKEELERGLDREATLQELAAALDVRVEELAQAMDACAEVESLHKTVYQGDGNEILLMDKLPEQINPQDCLLNHLLLEEMLGSLEAKERQLIYMRYFQDMTQAQIALELGATQVQVSRLEKRILERLRKGQGENCKKEQYT